MRPIFVALLSMALFSPAAAAGEAACEPTGSARAALDRTEHLAEQCGNAPACLGEWRQALETARRRHPRDVFVHRAYQDLLTRGSLAEPAKPIEEYSSRAAAHPDSALHLYLAGRATPDEPAERAFYERALAGDPDFPWAQIGLAVALDTEDPKRSRELALAFTRLCPARIDMLAHLTALDGKEDMAPIAAAARRALAGREDRGVLPLYSALWAVEFRSTPPAGHDAARERVRGDLAVLADLGLAGELAYWRTLEAGANLTGDQEAVRRAQDARWRIAPCASDSMTTARKRWDEENPMPMGPGPESARVAWLQKRYQAGREWTSACPYLAAGWKVRLEAALVLPELSTEQALAEIDAAMPFLERAPGIPMTFSVSLLAAQEYVERGVRLGEVPRLAEKGRLEVEERIRQFMAYSGLSEDLARGAELMRWNAVWGSRLAEAGASLATGGLAEARSQLATLAELRTALVPRDDDDGYSKMLARNADSTLWELKGRLAEAEKRDLDALALYGKALGVAGEKAELLARTQAVWDRLGGGEEGWAAFSMPAEVKVAEVLAERWREKNQALADFSLVDVTGRTWTLSDFKGKRVLINFWATWCKPCHMELPHLQKLHDQLAGDPNALVLTVSIDENPGLVAPFTAKRGLTLPTLLGYEFYKQMANDGAVPRNWLIDDRGVLRLEQLGFDPDSVEPWLEDLLAKLKEGRGLEAPGR